MQFFDIYLQNYVNSFNIVTMNETFVKSNTDIISAIKQSSSDEKYFLYENNLAQIKKIENFFKSNEKLLMISGFLGTGKKELLDKTLSFLNSDVIYLEYTCYETTILDDILLSFFDTFKNLIAMGLIEQPRIKSENFIQKINTYFQTIDKPIIVRINALQNILKDNKSEILGFLKTLFNYQNIKVILSSRKQETLFDTSGIMPVVVMTGALEKNIFEKYLKSEGIKNIGPISDELYKHTRGYWLYTILSVKVIKLRGLELINFLSGYTKSMISFNDFIFRELLSFVDPISGHLFRFLTLMRHPVSINLLKDLKLWDENKEQFFIENLILYRSGNLISLPEHYKSIAQNTITENISVKIHKACIELYETQIPLKPFERDMLLSRATMRKEIEFHNSFIPQRPKFNREPLTGIQFAIREKSEQTSPEAKETPEHNQVLETSKEAVKKVSFIFDEDALENIAETINNFVESSHENAIVQDEINNLNLVELLNQAKISEKNFEYKKVIAICQKALTMNTDDDFYTFLPSIYLKLANTYKKLSDWFSANKYFELATEFFDSTGDIEKSAQTRLEIANIKFLTYKQEEAKEIVKEILLLTNISSNTTVKTLLLLIDIAENSNNRNEIELYFEKALNLSETIKDIEILSELYFKWAVFNDTEGKLDLAIEYYKKCINLSKNYKENPNLASSYSNIASICKETGNIELALKYANESLKINELTGNFNGIYNSSIQLAQMYKSKDFDKTVEFYKMAKNSAHKLNEPFYIASVNLNFGDFIIHYGQIENALKLYLEALAVAKDNFKPSNISKIELRINDIKSKIGEEKFNNIAKEVNSGQNI